MRIIRSLIISLVQYLSAWVSFTKTLKVFTLICVSCSFLCTRTICRYIYDTFFTHCSVSEGGLLLYFIELPTTTGWIFNTYNYLNTHSERFFCIHLTAMWHQRPHVICKTDLSSRHRRPYGSQCFYFFLILCFGLFDRKSYTWYEMFLRLFEVIVFMWVSL